MRRMTLCRLVSALCLVACKPAESPVSTPDFSSGEHVILGDEGYRAACSGQTYLCATQLTRADGKESFRYGELVAFSGDFYARPADIYAEQEKSIFAWNRNDIDDVKKKFQAEVETIENFLHGHSDQEYPDFNVAFAWNYPDYLSITLANTPHFGFYNMIAYVDYHSQALSLAMDAHQKWAAQSVEARALLTQALFMNAFADHFLTDGFAAGHIRNPRMQILEWVKGQEMSDRAAGTLAKIIHDRDGEVRESGEHGLLVINARGDQWLTRCDAQLFWKNSMPDPSIQWPVQAVEASIREVFQVYREGSLPSGVYAATNFVPFPAPEERTLTQLFPKDMPEAEYDRIMKQMAFYIKIKAFSGVDKAVLKKLTADLPVIMQNFGRDVKNELAKNPVLSQRLPTAYVEAYQNVQ